MLQHMRVYTVPSWTYLLSGPRLVDDRRKQWSLMKFTSVLCVLELWLQPEGLHCGEAWIPQGGREQSRRPATCLECDEELGLRRWKQDPYFFRKVEERGILRQSIQGVASVLTPRFEGFDSQVLIFCAPITALIRFYLVFPCFGMLEVT